MNKPVDNWNPSDSTVLTSQQTSEQDEEKTVNHDYRNDLETKISKYKTGAFIYLGRMSLTDQDIPSIIQQAVRDKRCGRLSIENNRLTSNALKKLIVELIEGKNTSLWWLDLSSNIEIGNTGFQYLPRLLQSDNRTLKYLLLKDTGLTDSGFECLLKALAENSSLKGLDVSFNKLITDKCLSPLISMLARNNTLHTLQLVGCGLSETSKNHLESIVSARKSTNFILGL